MPRKKTAAQPVKKSTYKGYTETRKRNNAIYDSKHERMTIRVLPEEKRRLKESTSKKGISVNKAVLESLKQCGYL